MGTFTMATTIRQLVHRRARHHANTRTRAITSYGPRIVWRHPAFDLERDDKRSVDVVVRHETQMIAASFDGNGGHAVYGDGEIRAFAFV